MLTGGMAVEFLYRVFIFAFTNYNCYNKLEFFHFFKKKLFWLELSIYMKVF